MVSHAARYHAAWLALPSWAIDRQAGSGEWREYTLYFNGLKMIRNCSRVPRTTQVGATSIGPARPVGAGAQRAAWLATTYHAASLAGARAAGWLAQAIEAIPEAVSMVGGSIYWSMLPEGTHLKSHCGPSNTRSAVPPYPHRDWAHPFHICTGTGLTPATSAPGRRSAK